MCQRVKSYQICLVTSNNSPSLHLNSNTSPSKQRKYFEHSAYENAFFVSRFGFLGEKIKNLLELKIFISIKYVA